jgi:hypothetical protein
MINKYKIKLKFTITKNIRYPVWVVCPGNSQGDLSFQFFVLEDATHDEERESVWGPIVPARGLGEVFLPCHRRFGLFRAAAYAWQVVKALAH